VVAHLQIVINLSTRAFVLPQLNQNLQYSGFAESSLGQTGLMTVENEMGSVHGQNQIIETKLPISHVLKFSMFILAIL
jgi:hypothetical protein